MKPTCVIAIIYRCVPLVAFMLVVLSGKAQNAKDSLLAELRIVMSQGSGFDEVKIARIDSLRTLSGATSGRNRFLNYQQLYNEYASFNFDSAFVYAALMRVAAPDSVQASYAILKKAQILLSSGMFKETFEALAELSSVGYSDAQKAEYYSVQARSHFDLAEYHGTTAFSGSYNSAAELYIDSCISISSEKSFFSLYYKGLKGIRSGDLRTADRYFKTLIQTTSLSLPQQAIVYSTYSDIYIRREIIDSAIQFLAKAAIADIKASTKETTAILNLATLLFRLGDVSNASTFIQKAANDARIYGARQRKIQLSNIMPIIEAERLATIEREKFSITRYATVTTLFLLFLITLAVIIFRQLRQLKHHQSEIQKKNISLHRLVEEKEWLLREVHHRVKNNLHTINSLLESQSAYLKDDALAAIRNSQQRVFAMALVHQKLYQPQVYVTNINMVAYLHELVSYIRDSFDTGNKLQFRMDVDELKVLELDIAVAVPLGLILNEAITNSVKYAFPGERKGTITISVTRQSANNAVFSVTDNGVGLPADFDSTQTKSLGLKLIKGLCEDISAGFRYESVNGTSIIIELKLDIHDHPADPKIESYEKN